LASLESGGAHALAFSSGSATTATILQSLGAGAHVLSVNDVYGGTRRYMTQVAGAQGLDVTFLDLEVSAEETIIEALQPNTKVRTYHSTFFWAIKHTDQ
jgi:cystathionine gamma-lyase